MGTPIFRTELLEFRAQAVSVNRQPQANERLRKLHFPKDGSAWRGDHPD